MKKWLIPACIVGVLLMGSAVMLTKETNKKYVITKTGGSFDYVWQTKSGIQPSGKIVTIPLDDNLVRLENQTNSNISQFCAPGSPSIEIDAALLAVLDQTQLKQGIIASSKNIKLSQQMPDISINLGKPITEANNQGTGNFVLHCTGLKKLTLHNFGTGNITVGDSYLIEADVQNRGTGDIIFNVGHMKNVTVDTRGTGSVSFRDVDTATVSLYGVGNVTFGNTPKITSTVKGLGNIKTNTPHPDQ